MRRTHAVRIEQAGPLPLVVEPPGEPVIPAAGHRATPEEPAPAGPAPSQADGRDPLLDNAKFLAIALVVVGHAIEPLVKDATIEMPILRAFYMAIYTFHMPVFILIAGRLSRGFTGKPHQAKRLITGIVVPYLVFEVSYELFNHYVAGGSASIDVLDPSYAMWFLTALFVWRVTSPLWRAMRPVHAVVLAVALSVGSGLVALPQLLDVYRMLGFLPFFVFGLVASDRYFAFLRTGLARWLAVPTLAAPFVAALAVFPDTQLNWLYYTYSYETMGVDAGVGVVGRLLMLVAGFAASTAFLALLPRRHAWFTSLGVGTLYVYLVHRFVVKTAEYSELYEQAWMHTLPGIISAVAAAVAVALVLASKPARFLFQPVVEPRLAWLFRRTDRRHAKP